MKALITGSSGFAGKHLQNQMKNFGFEVYNLKSNILDKNSLKHELSQVNPNYIIHLAASSFVGDENISEMYRVNILGTSHLLESCIGLKKIKNVVLTSSANVYGSNSCKKTSENINPAPVNHYAISKYSMEKLVNIYKEHFSIVISRPFNFTGVGQNEKFIIPKLISAFKRKEKIIKLGNLDVSREFNDVNFFCEATMMLLLHAKPNEIFNICTGKTHNLRELIKYLCLYFNYEPDFVTDSTFTRQNEIKIIGGCDEKLLSLQKSSKFKLSDISLEETINKMANGE